MQRNFQESYRLAYIQEVKLQLSWARLEKQLGVSNIKWFTLWATTYLSGDFKTQARVADKPGLCLTKATLPALEDSSLLLKGSLGLSSSRIQDMHKRVLGGGGKEIK